MRPKNFLYIKVYSRYFILSLLQFFSFLCAHFNVVNRFFLSVLCCHLCHLIFLSIFFCLYYYYKPFTTCQIITLSYFTVGIGHFF
jgi:hypothetical protein